MNDPRTDLSFCRRHCLEHSITDRPSFVEPLVSTLQTQLVSITCFAGAFLGLCTTGLALHFIKFPLGRCSLILRFGVFDVMFFPPPLESLTICRVTRSIIIWIKSSQTRLQQIQRTRRYGTHSIYLRRELMELQYHGAPRALGCYLKPDAMCFATSAFSSCPPAAATCSADLLLLSHTCLTMMHKVE